MEPEEWLRRVDEISNGYLFVFHDELWKFYEAGVSPEGAWAEVSKNWSPDEALRPVAAMLAHMAVPIPERDD